MHESFMRHADSVYVLVRDLYHGNLFLMSYFLRRFSR